MISMTLEEARQAIKEAEAEITQRLQQLMADTGLLVTEVSIIAEPPLCGIPVDQMRPDFMLVSTKIKTLL